MRDLRKTRPDFRPSLTTLRIRSRLRPLYGSQREANSASRKNDAARWKAARLCHERYVRRGLVAVRRAIRARRWARKAQRPRGDRDISRAIRPGARSRLPCRQPVERRNAARLLGDDFRSAAFRHGCQSCDLEDRRDCRDRWGRANRASRVNRCRADRPGAQRISKAEDCARQLVLLGRKSDRHDDDHHGARSVRVRGHRLDRHREIHHGHCRGHHLRCGHR
jgi:hypothetical protein